MFKQPSAAGRVSHVLYAAAAAAVDRSIIKTNNNSY